MFLSYKNENKLNNSQQLAAISTVIYLLVTYVSSKLMKENVTWNTKSHLSEQINTFQILNFFVSDILSYEGTWFQLIKSDCLTFALLIMLYSDTIPVTVITDDIALWVSLWTVFNKTLQIVALWRSCQEETRCRSTGKCLSLPQTESRCSGWSSPEQYGCHL